MPEAEDVHDGQRTVTVSCSRWRFVRAGRCRMVPFVASPQNVGEQRWAAGGLDRLSTRFS